MHVFAFPRGHCGWDGMATSPRCIRDVAQLFLCLIVYGRRASLSICAASARAPVVLDVHEWKNQSINVKNTHMHPAQQHDQCPWRSLLERRGLLWSRTTRQGIQIGNAARRFSRSIRCASTREDLAGVFSRDEMKACVVLGTGKKTCEGESLEHPSPLPPLRPPLTGHTTTRRI